MINTTVTTPPAIESITLAIAKQHCRVYHSLDDGTFGTGSVGSGLISAAREMIESEIRGPIINTGYTTVFSEFPAGRELLLPRSPLVSVSSVRYINSADATITLSPTTDYAVKSYNGMGRVILRDTASWPGDLHDGPQGVVTVVYTAGYGTTAAEVPVSLRHAQLLQIATLYEFRSTLSPGTITLVPEVIKRLVSQFSNGNYV